MSAEVGASLTPPPELVSCLAQAKRVLITSHANPDGDAIGSESGLARALLSIGKQVVIWNRDPTPALYAPWTDGLEILVGEEPPVGFPEAFDLVFFVECPTIGRSGHEPVFGSSVKINVDHHLGNDNYGAHNWVLPHVASVSVMIFAIAQALSAELDQLALDSLLLGLVTDTGGFRFSNTTTDAHLAAAGMVAAGASPERVSKWLFESRPEPAVRLLGEVLRTLELNPTGEVATVVLNKEMLVRTKASQQDGESLIDFPRSIAGVEIAALFREIGSGQYKVSLRSRGPVSVEAVARRHGGGGHRNAAGCSVNGPLTPARSSIVSELEQALTDAAP